MATSSTIDQLNSFLRGELSAVETYRMALETFRQSPVEAALRECMQSHAHRADVLRSAIAQRGGEPSESSGAWGAFAKTVQGAADTFGTKAAIATLEEGEDHGLADYKRDMASLDTATRALVELELLPAQRATHRVLSELKDSPLLNT